MFKPEPRVLFESNERIVGNAYRIVRRAPKFDGQRVVFDLSLLTLGVDGMGREVWLKNHSTVLGLGDVLTTVSDNIPLNADEWTQLVNDQPEDGEQRSVYEDHLNVRRANLNLPLMRWPDRFMLHVPPDATWSDERGRWVVADAVRQGRVERATQEVERTHAEEMRLARAVDGLIEALAVGLYQLREAQRAAADARDALAVARGSAPVIDARDLGPFRTGSGHNPLVTCLYGAIMRSHGPSYPCGAPPDVRAKSGEWYTNGSPLWQPPHGTGRILDVIHSCDQRVLVSGEWVDDPIHRQAVLDPTKGERVIPAAAFDRAAAAAREEIDLSLMGCGT